MSHSLRVLLGAAALAALAPPLRGAPPAPDPMKGLEFRNIGPALMGGRIDDVAVVESRPSTFYVATASGGLWKTTNNGVTFEPVFDDQATSSIGDVTLAPSDPGTLYVGTGEPNNRQSSSWGNGVYRSRDGGRTWTHAGLAETRHIGRIVVHPTNPEVAYVAALGHLWGPNKERGLYKTTDGGRTWTNTKFIDENTGFVDVAMDPESPDTLYAASFQRRRTPHGYNGGGPGGALWKTVDGGATWTKLTSGLPTEGDVGRIGVSVFRRDPRIVYALVEHTKETGIYRSDDRGETWRKASDTNPRPSYYSKVHVDPNNDQRIWVLAANMYNSEDGGKTFRSDLVQKIHGDYHALWINPADSNHVIAGSDGGIHVSYDRGRSWDFMNTIPLAQFYEVHYDMRSPYWVCGGLQDNGSWCGPSRTQYSQGIANEDWFRVGGGDGFFVAIDPSDHNILYSESQDGNLRRFDLRTNESRVIRPEPPAGEKYRFNWNSPIVISIHDPKTIYYGGNRVFGSKDRGETWTPASADLTSGALRDELPIFGKASKDFLSRNDGVVHWGTITTLAESPLKAGVLWAGTDDGHVQVSRDGGKTWTDVGARLPGVPAGTYVSRVEPSRTAEGAAYVAFDGHRGNDYNAYVVFTPDFGQTWRNVTANLPAGHTVSVVREHPRQPNLLFAGTEQGLWASLNRGRSWQRLKGKNLPTVPVEDVQVHPRDDDLILGTHGRGVYILDDLGPLAEMAARGDRTLDALPSGSTPELFPVRGGVQHRMYSHKGNTGHKAFFGPNPPDGVLVTYLLPAKPAEKETVTLTVKDAAGAVVREIKGTREAGINRVNWDLRHEAPVKPEPGEGGGGFFGPPRGPLVPPGDYTVTLAAGGTQLSRPVKVSEDPRITITDADRRDWYETARRASRMWARADGANRTLERVKKQLASLQESLGRKRDDEKAPEAVTSATKALAGKVETMVRRFSRQNPVGFAGAPLADEPDPLLARARGGYLVVSGYTAAPTAQHRDLIDRTEKELDQALADTDALMKEVDALNRLLLQHGLGRLETGKPAS